jgi:DNA-binding LacI/PurR family transcriptional regulator
MMDRRTTRLVDVATAAGVSRSTASNVFNNPAVVRPELRERVEAAARTLGYLGPDPKARVLRAGKLNSIGVMAPARWGVADMLGNPVFAQFLTGVGQVCDQVGANLMVIPDTSGNDGVRSALVDGFIFGRVEHMDEVERMRLRRLPFTVVDFDAGPDVGSVRVDARVGCAEAARHLLALGHRRFAVMSFLRDGGPARLFPPGAPRGPDAAGMLIDQEKLRGYADALAGEGLSIDDVPILRADPRDGAAAGLLLDSAPDATAFLSMSVMQAIAIINEARRRGRIVPRDLSVIGFNDIAEAERCDPPLTTVDGCTQEKGRRAARLVFDGGPPVQEVITPTLILRGSTGRAR